MNKLYIKRQQQIDDENEYEATNLRYAQRKSSSNNSRYENTMRSYNDHDHERFRKLNEQHDWVELSTVKSEPPSDYTVTHINQTHDFLRLGDLNAAFHMNQNSKEWLKTHGVEFLKLSLKDLLDKGKITKPVADKSGKAIQHITFDATVINEFEYKLNLALEMYSKRIKWLMQSSRKSFGLVQGDRVAVLIDSSSQNMSFGRAVDLQDSLMNLITEQLCHKKQFYFATFGTEANELWSDILMDVHHRSVEEAKIFIAEMRQSGGCNLLKALKKVFKIENIDSIVIILGTIPDQSMDAIVDFVEQSIVNKNSPLHCVTYEMNNHVVNNALRKLAENTNGRYHCYSNSQEQLIYNSTDISILLKEINRIQDILNRIKEMRQGMLGSALIRIENEIQMEIEKFPQAKFLPRPRGHDLPLKIEKSVAPIKASAVWLKIHGLKARKLNLYQLLAPNAYAPVEDFIPILHKTVQSTVHERVMAQFTWHDGTLKNLHVDFAALYEYQKQLTNTVKLYEQRIDWLASGSRKIFGAVTENSIVVLVDLSASNSKYLIHIQHSLRLLMEQQISNKKYFNIIGYGCKIHRWKPTVVPPTEKELQDAWKWVLELQCEGTRNTLGALKAALENEEERKHKIEIDGLYLFTSGIPDQPIDVCCAYLEEAACGRNLKLHSILFNVDDYDGNGAIPGRWANITKTAEALRSLAHSVDKGRFHWFRETGIIESDDIKLIRQEIDKAVHFSKKAAALVDSFRKKRNNSPSEINEDEDSSEEDYKSKPIPAPKPTTLTLQRLLMREKDSDDNKVKALGWRPNSAARCESVTIDGVRSRAKSADLKRPASAKSEAFYLNGKNNSKGSAVINYPSKKSVRKGIPQSTIPDKEEVITTKDWLRKYSLIKLKLDLYKLVSGPDCKHDTVVIGTLKKDVSARYCSIFPSININGVVRHLQLRPGELKDYQGQCEKILKRYVKRLQWLLSGSRRLFGTITHDKVAILIDTSGSMDDYLLELKRELSFLIWEQLNKQNASFNLIRFSSQCEKWRDKIALASEENCHRAIVWLNNLVAYGNTCTLDAIQEAFDDKDINAIYLLTDGKPDNSTTLVLDEVRHLNKERKISINVISFNCDEKSANDFLKQLAAENYGRYHRSSKTDRDIHLFAHKILTEGVQDSYLSHIPDFEGDDLKRLAEEIKKSKEYLRQSITFSKMYDKRGEFAEEVLIGPIRINSVKDQQTRHKECIPVDFMK